MDGSTMGLAAETPSARNNVTVSQADNDRRWPFESDGMPRDERIPCVSECGAAQVGASWTAAVPGHVIDDAKRMLIKHPHFRIIDVDSGGRDPLPICR
jgi:hypothetical protein